MRFNATRQRGHGGAGGGESASVQSALVRTEFTSELEIGEGEMKWLPFLVLLLLFQMLIYSLHRLKARRQLNRHRFAITLALFFSAVFFVGATGLTDFSWKTLTVWGGIALLQLLAGYLLAHILRV